jgi:NAD(P)-dependent dehydrogenase (short-subunit alcohol dehydrogenase family)
VAAAQEAADAAVEAGSPHVITVSGDVSVDGSVYVDRTVEMFGRLDGVVVTAVPVITGRVMDAGRADLRAAFEAVVGGFHDVVVTARPALAATQGAVVAVSSLGSERYAGYYGALGPAKAALECLVRYLSVELGRDGIRVNAVSPCLVDDLQHFDDAPEVMAFLEATAKRTPLSRRLATPSDIAVTLAELVAGAGFATVTGQVIRADGGYSLVG